MENLIQDHLSNVNSRWSKDLIIRYLYRQLAPYFRRNLKYFLASKEEQLKIYKQGFKCSGPEIVCKSLCDFYEETFKSFNIRSKIVPATNTEIPLFVLIVEGDDVWYYLDPLGDLTFNQYGIFPHHFGHMTNFQKTFILKQYPFVQNLPIEYIEELDEELGITHIDAFLDELSKIMKVNNHYQKLVKMDRSASKLEVIQSKLEYASDNLINIGQVNGLLERIQLYNYLFKVIFKKPEKPKIRTEIFNDKDGPGLSVLITSDDYITTYRETKSEDTGYSLKKVKD